jgi:hypothetical protein
LFRLSIFKLALSPSAGNGNRSTGVRRPNLLLIMEVKVQMKPSHRLFAITATLTLLTFLPIINFAAPQALSSLSANAKGVGTLYFGKEVFKVHSVAVNLKEDGTGELILITDLTLFVNCTWTAPADLSKGIDLKIVPGASASSAEGSGKLLLKPDGKSIATLSVDGRSKTQQRKIKLDFVAE